MRAKGDRLEYEKQRLLFRHQVQCVAECCLSGLKLTSPFGWQLINQQSKIMEFDNGLKNILTLGESLDYIYIVALRIYL